MNPAGPRGELVAPASLYAPERCTTVATFSNVDDIAHLLQQRRITLNDPAMEEALHDVPLLPL